MTELYYNSQQTADALNCKMRSLYRLKGIKQVRTQHRVIGKQVHKFYLIEDVQKLVEWRQSEEFHRKAKENKAKAARASAAARTAQAQPVTKQGVALKRHKTPDGRQYLVAPAMYEIPERWDWRANL